MIPTDAVSVIDGEAVVKVVITFPIGQHSPKPIVPRGNMPVKIPMTEHVRVRIDEKGRMHDQNQS